MKKRIKTGGRVQGTPNKTTKEIRELINFIVSNNIDNLQSDIDSLEPKDRLKFICDLLPFAIPKLQMIQADLNGPAPPPLSLIFMDLSKPEPELTKEQIEKL